MRFPDTRLLQVSFLVIIEVTLFLWGSADFLNASCAPPPTGLVGWWSGDGNANDALGTSNGTLMGNTAYAPGVVGQGFLFDGSGDVVNVGNSAGLQLQNFSIEAWVKRNNTNFTSNGTFQEGLIFGYGDGGYGFIFQYDGALVLNKIGVPIASYSPFTILDADWHHVGVTKSNAVVFFYLDGTAYRGNDFGATFSFTSPVGIGARADNLDNSFIGLIDEVSVYSRPLAATEMQSIYNASSAGKCALAPSPPIILSQPTGQIVGVGNSATFSVTASGSASLAYQWRFNGEIIVGATTSSFVRTNAQLADAGNYSVMVTNVAGTMTSSNAILRVISGGPIAWWPGDGNANDISGGFNGTLLNGVSFDNGKSGQCFNFGGNNSHVNFGSSIGNFGTGDFTISHWVKTTATTPQAFFEKRPACNMDFGTSWWGIRGPAIFGIEVAGPRNEFFTGLQTKKTLNDGAWHHLAWTRRGTSLSVYVDSVLDNVATTPGIANINNSTDTKLGVSSCDGVDGTGPFNGSADEIKIFDRALSGDEVQAMYNEGNSGPPIITSPPANRSVVEGGSAAFEVVATGAVPFSYQWRFNGANIQGATLSSYTLSSASPSNEGDYSVVVTNGEGSATSANAHLTVVAASSLPPGLIAWWTGDGNANDVIGNNNGMPVGGADFVPGQLGEAFQFDGIDNAIYFGNSIGNFGTNDFTICHWVKTTSTTPQAFFEKRPACNMDYGTSWWSIRGPAIFGIEVGGPRLQYFTGLETKTTLNDGAWHHLAWIRQKTNLLVYVDGVLNNSVGTPGIADVNNTTATKLGLSSCDGIDGTGPFSGAADEIQIYNRALSASEIQGVYNADNSTESRRPPVIVLQPQNQSGNQGNSPTFKVTAVGTHPLSYQWQRGAANIPGATGETLTITNLQETNGFRVVVSNPFGTVTSQTAYILHDLPSGIYQGLFYESDAVKNESSGFLRLSLARSGTFSGNIWIAARPYRFSGSLSAGESNITVSRTNGPPVTIGFTVITTNGFDEIHGFVSDGHWTASLEGDRLVYNTKTRPAPQAGQYTFAFANSYDETGPQGKSYGTVTVLPSGVVKLSASLSDDYRASQSAGLSAHGDWPLYAPLYRGTGSVLGWITFTNQPASSFEGNVSWIKEHAFGKYFNKGFTNEGLLAGSVYLRPTNRSPINVTNAIVALRGTSINISNDVALNSTNAVTAGPTKYQILTINPRFGTFQGNVVDPANNTKIPIKGALLQQSTNGSGFFVRTNFNGQVNIEPKHSD